MIVSKKTIQDRNKQIFIDRLTYPDMTYQQIAKKHNISGNRARQIFERMLRKTSYSTEVKTRLPKPEEKDIDYKYSPYLITKIKYWRDNKTVLIAHLHKVS